MPETVKPRIKVYTRSMNPALYRISMSFLDLPYPRVRLTDTTAEGYLLKAVRDEEADFVVNIDEDAFVTDNERLRDLIHYAIDNDFVSVGMPDGGVVGIRAFHPGVTNPFFTLMNTKKVREIIGAGFPADVDPTDPALREQIPPGMLRTPWELVDYEPYYPFFFALARLGKILYLDAKEHPDGITTELLDHLGRPFLLHTWWSRWYGRDIDHTDRICAIRDEAVAKSRRGRKTSVAERLRLRQGMIEYRGARKLARFLHRRYGV